MDLMRSPEGKLLRLVIVVGLAALIIWYAATNVPQVKDALKSPGLTSLKAILFVLAATAALIIFQIIINLLTGRVALIQLSKIWGYLVKSLVILIIAVALLLMANMGWFGANWTIIPP